MSIIKDYSQDTDTPTRSTIILTIICCSVIGVLVSSEVVSRFVWISLYLLIAVVTFTVFAKTRSAVHSALLLVIISVTIHNSRFGIPFKPDSVAVPLLALVLFWKARKQVLSLKSYPLLLPICGFVIVNFLSSYLNSPVYELSVRQSFILLGRAFTFLCVVIALQSIPEIRQKIPIYLGVLLITQTVVSIVALLAYSYVPTPFIMIGQTGGLSRSINGFFLEANLFGIFALCVISIIMPMALFSRKERRAPLYLVLLVGIIAIILSYTRSTWIGSGLLVGYISIFMLTKPSASARNSYKKLVSLFAVFVIYASCFITTSGLLGVNSYLSNRFLSIIDQRSISVVQRLNVWGPAINEWRQNIWLGHGPLSFIRTNPSSNGWLYGSLIQTLHDSGIIGLVLMLCICGYGIVWTLRAYYVADDDIDRGIVLGYLLSQASLFFTSQFSSFFWGGFSWVLIALSVGHSNIIIRKYRDAVDYSVSDIHQNNA